MALLTTRTQEPIPGYRVVQRIGAGGYGEVWAAQAPGDLKKAIKFVYGLLDEDRAARELKALSRIKGVRHPFLLSLERIEVVDGQLLIVTELADCSLKDRYEECRKQGLPGIPRDELLKHLRDAADALDYMSDQHSLQHLDVKPENMLLLGGRIKVADFGLVKDIHDHTASMMGGLTPVYAPPEVFEGRPSKRSDQYSLAILYQEMLTGVLPFPGRTAAQLAAQHLNAKPRLAALPEADQIAVGKALSKKPDERYARCGDLVDALQNAGAGGSKRPVEAKEGSTTGSATQPVRTTDDMLADVDRASQVVGAETGLLGQPTQKPLARSSQPKPVRTSLTPEEAAAVAQPALPVGRGAPALSSLESAPPLVDQPPVKVEAPPGTRPTLFIGLGGCGAKILRRLRRRFDDRLSPEHRGNLAMLLLDTDARDLAAAVQGESLGQLRQEETVAMQLRRSQDYRSESGQLLEWLSRRWLYNIPRSQQTEGLRPLGRLAMADHAERVFGKVMSAVEVITQRARALEMAPRVIVCASLCGGTGGGIAADIAMAVRQKLEELQAEGAELLGVFAFGTNRNPQQQELATASGLSALTELAQYHRHGAVYPGDPGCKLNPRSASAGGLDAAYVVHVGEDLSPQKWDAACDEMAQFLLLDAITPAGHVLRAIRGETGEQPGLKVRSFGLYQLGFAQDRLVDDVVNRICNQAIGRWNGAANKPEARRTVARLLSAAQGPLAAARQSTPAPPSIEIEVLTSRLAQALGLDAEPMVQHVIGLATTELGGDADAFFQNLMGLAGPGAEGPQLERWLGAAGDLFGRSPDQTGSAATIGELAEALDQRIVPWIAERGGELQRGVEALVDEAGARVLGARKAARWLQSHLKSLVDRLRETRGRLEQEWRMVEQALHPAQLDRPAKGKLPRRTPEELAELYLQYCRLRLFDVAGQRAAQAAHALQSHAGKVHDELVDLSRELDHLAAQFPADDTQSHRISATSLEFCTLRETVAEQLHSAEEALARQLDEQIAKSLFVEAGGLRAAICKGGEARQQLLTLLRTSSRQMVLNRLQSIDLASLLLQGSDSESPLHKCLIDAQPRLQACGGQRRLLIVLPQQVAEHYDPAKLAEKLGPDVFRQLPTIVPDASSDMVLLYELGEISLPHVAAQLCDFRPDLVDAAGRLHTRCDVTWTPLVS